MLLQNGSVQYGMAKKDAAAAANPQVYGTLQLVREVAIVHTQ